MKKTICAIMCLMLAGIAHAQVGSPDNECSQFGFGIAKWEFNDDLGIYELSEEGEKTGYTTSVTGDADQANWTSSPAADGVITKEGPETNTHPGGTSGTIDKDTFGISHVTLCAEETDEIPEFSTVGAALALLGAGFFAWKKRN